MFIQTQPMSDPDSLRFLPGQPVLPGGILTMQDRIEAAASPLAAALFELEGVASVTLGPDYIVVGKQGKAWDHLKPMLLGLIADHFVMGVPIMRDASSVAGFADEGPLAAGIRQALGGVIDPELGYNIVGLGLVYAVTVDDDGEATITMTTTTPGCPATNYLKNGAYQAALGVKGVHDAEVVLTYDPRWEPDMMSAEARAWLGF